MVNLCIFGEKLEFQALSVSISVFSFSVVSIVVEVPFKSLLLYKVEFPLSRALHISRHVTNSAHKSSTRVPSCNTLHFINETLDYCIPLFVLITELSLIPIGPYIVYEKHVVLRFDLFLTPKKSSSALFRFNSSFFLFITVPFPFLIS